MKLEVQPNVNIRFKMILDKYTRCWAFSHNPMCIKLWACKLKWTHVFSFAKISMFCNTTVCDCLKCLKLILWICNYDTLQLNSEKLSEFQWLIKHLDAGTEISFHLYQKLRPAGEARRSDLCVVWASNPWVIGRGYL